MQLSMFMASWSSAHPPQFQSSCYVLRDESPKAAIESRLLNWGLKPVYRRSTEDTEIALCAVLMDCQVGANQGLEGGAGSDHPTYLLIITAHRDG